MSAHLAENTDPRRPVEGEKAVWQKEEEARQGREEPGPGQACGHDSSWGSIRGTEIDCQTALSMGVAGAKEGLGNKEANPYIRKGPESPALFPNLFQIRV